MADKVKQLLFVVLLASGFIGYYLLADQAQLVRVGVVLGASVVALAVGASTLPGQEVWEFLKDARAETRKVVWPTRKETTQMTIIVFVVVVLASLLLWAFDWGLSLSVKALLGTGN